MKIIKPISRYIDSAKIEAEILYDIKEKSPDNKFDVIKNTTINKKEKRMKEIEAELKMITEGNFEMF